MVVTELNAPMSVLARDSVREMIPTTPASTATMTEETLGVLIRSKRVGRPPRTLVVSPATRIERHESERRRCRRETESESRETSASCSAISSGSARATAVMAPCSGPTTMAATMGIWESTRMPMEPMRPAMKWRGTSSAGRRRQPGSGHRRAPIPA
jgi:hypothetical protein